jgi:glycopeptide antibiotics resistance protein
MATMVALLAILVCTLFPFHFHVRDPSFRSGWDVLLIPIGPDRTPDILENVLLFVPLGFTMTGYFTHRRIKTLVAITGVLLLSLCVSYSVEILQLFMPGRFASLTDVLSNTAGAGVGVLCHSGWHRADK